MKNFTLLFILLIGMKIYSQETSVENQNNYKSGISKIMQKDFSGGIDDLSKAIETNPTNHLAYYYRGIAKAAIKQFDGAISDFNKAHEIKPEYTNSLSQRGKAKYAIKNYQGAIDDYNKILKINPSTKAINWVYIYRGLAYSAMEIHTEAVRDYKKAMDIVFSSDDMEYKSAWPNFKQIQIIKESFKKVSKQTDMEPIDKIINKWEGIGPWRIGNIIDIKKDGTILIESEGLKSYEVLYSANNSYMILLYTDDTLFGHMVIKVINNEKIIIKELWDNKKAPMLLDEYTKYKKPTIKPVTQINFNEALKIMGLAVQDNYQIRGKDINVPGINKDKPKSKTYTRTGNWDEDAELIKLFKTVDSLKIKGTLQKISEEAIEVASYLDPFDPLEGYIPLALILFENKQYNDASFLYYLGMMRESYYESVNFKSNNFHNPREYESIKREYQSIFNNFLELDINNFIFILQAVYDYFEKHDYSPEPKQVNLEIYNTQLKQSKEFIDRVKDPRDYPQRYNNNPNKIEEILQFIDNEIALSQKVIVSKENIVGEWTSDWETGYNLPKVKKSFISFEKNGKCTFPSEDEIVFKLIKELDNDLYYEIEKFKNYEVSYSIDYKQSPIEIIIALKIPSIEKTIHLNYIAKFLEEDVLKIGVPYLNSPNRYISNRTIILTRENVGSKNYFDYKNKYPPLAVNDTTILSNKELKLFWNDKILPIIRKDTSIILNNTIFPIKTDYQESDYTEFQESRMKRYLFDDKINLALQELDYKYVDQVLLESGEMALMVYILLKPYYDYYEKPSYKSVGMMFVNIGGTWKLNNLINSNSDGQLESILREKKSLIHLGSEHSEQRLFLQKYIAPITTLDKENILKTIQFPLKGNWGNALGFTNNSIEWKKSDFSENLDVFFNDEIRQKLKNNKNFFRYFSSTSNNLNKSISGGIVTIDGKKYLSNIDMTYKQIEGEWKLVELNWEGRSSSKKRKRSKPHQLQPKEFENFTNEYLIPIIELDPKTIISQTIFPFDKNSNKISEKEFKNQLNELFPKDYRESLKSIDPRSIAVQIIPGREEKINGIYVRDPDEIKLGVYLNFDRIVIYKKENESWYLTQVYGNKVK